MTQTNLTVDREKREIIITRIFDAPRELVFKTYTDPDLLPQWWGVKGQTIVDKMDVRPGGAWRFVQRLPNGNESAYRGEYREVVPPEKLAYTFEVEAMPGRVMLETITFEDHEGKTKLTDTSRYDHLEDLEGMVQAGAEEGADAMWNLLADFLKQLQSEK